MHETSEIRPLVHENFLIVMSFAVSRPVLAAIVETEFRGEWRSLKRTIYERGEIRADRALLEFATQLRILDDVESIADEFEKLKHPPLGFVIQADGSKTDLYLRDFTNKVIHSAHFEWVLQMNSAPRLICHSKSADRWKIAEINLIALMALVGQIAH